MRCLQKLRDTRVRNNHTMGVQFICKTDILGRLAFKFEAAYDKRYNKTCATSEDSDQPGHPPI